MLNKLGYALLKEGMTNESIEIFRLNADAYPKSANVYDSLGEAYLKNKQIDNAIENYKKSLQLNPKNANAFKILEELKNEK